MTHTGSCLCGAVTFRVEGLLGAPSVCHCGQCRKSSGHLWADTEVPKAALTVTKDEGLAWFQSSEKVRRGFCRVCGSSLFWEPLYRDWIGIGMGAFDGPTGVKVAKHVFTAAKGDYYDIADGLPQESAPP